MILTALASTIVNGINDTGKLVGFYGAAPINTGFVATPSGVQPLASRRTTSRSWTNRSRSRSAARSCPLMQP